MAVAWKELFGVNWNERDICIGYSIFGYVLTSHASVGGLGIAIYRVVYIKVCSCSKVQSCAMGKLL